MMASSTKKPFNDPDWIFEAKLDDYRALAVIDSTDKARIWSRNRLPLEQKFPTVRDAAEELTLRSTILDGEIVVLDEEGIPRFRAYAFRWRETTKSPSLGYLGPGTGQLYEVITQMKSAQSAYSIVEMCLTLAVSRSGLYDHAKKLRRDRRQQDVFLAQKSSLIFLESRRTDGWARPADASAPRHSLRQAAHPPTHGGSGA
jgi:hypothetical protein